MIVVELTPLHQQAIEAVASALYDFNEPKTSRCGWCAFSAAQGDTHEAYVTRERINDHDFSVRRENEDSPVPSRYTLIADLFVGHLEAVNDTPLAGIVAAAERVEPCATCRVLGPHTVNTEDGSVHVVPKLNASAFFAALAVEGIAKGNPPTHICAAECTEQSHIASPIQSWFTEHARFTLHGEPGVCSQTVNVFGEELDNCDGQHEYHEPEGAVREGCKPGEGCSHHEARYGREFIIPAIRIGGGE
jgi:hypothetical protein